MNDYIMLLVIFKYCLWIMQLLLLWLCVTGAKTNQFVASLTFKNATSYIYDGNDS